MFLSQFQWLYSVYLWKKKPYGIQLTPITHRHPPLPTSMHHMNLSFGAFSESVVATLFIFYKNKFNEKENVTYFFHFLNYYLYVLTTKSLKKKYSLSCSGVVSLGSRGKSLSLSLFLSLSLSQRYYLNIVIHNI